MSLSKHYNLKTFLHPGSFRDVKKWLEDEKASMSDKDLDILALESLQESMNSKSEPDTEKALKIFNIKLKQHIKNSKENP